MALTDNIIADYRFLEGSGTSTADASGTQANATLSGSTLPTWVAGGGLTFNGTTAYVDCGTALNPAAITYVAWISTASSTPFPNTYNSVIGRGGATNHFSDLFIGSGGKLTSYMGQGGGYIFIDGTGTSTLVAATDYCIGVTCDFNATPELATYVGGSLDASTGTANGVLSLTTDALPTYIGQDASLSGRWFKGTLKRVMVWSRAITSTEMAQVNTNGVSFAYFGGGGGGSIILPPYLFDTRAC
jgi:hypothetical protein